ncbi:hypothetical protein BGW39_000291 [Mortierella sp. 14UC]|nr:hypothetical protein BGW39_000291 [Mortierella sp. 14UC]
MDPELRQQLRVDDPMEEPELNLDGLPISSIQVLLEPPTEAPAGDDEDEDGFYSPLDHFRNLVKLSMSSSQCHSLDGFPPLPLLRSLHLADNYLSSGFEALAEADLQSLVLLDLSANNIREAAVLAPLDALENLQHLMLEGNPVSETQGYREAVFEVLPQLISLDSMDRDGTKLDVDEDALSSGDEGAHFPGNVEDEEEYDNDGGDGELEDEDEDIDEVRQPSSHSRHYQPAGEESEDIGSQDEDDEEEEYEGEVKHGSDEDEDSDVESGQERPMTGGKTTGGYDQGDEDEDLEDEEDEEDEEEDDEDGAHHHHTSQTPQQHQHQHVQEIHGSGSEDEEDDDDEEEEEEEEEIEEEDEEEEEEEEDEEAPGLAYLLTDNIPDENDDEFEPEADPEEESEMESSDEDEYGSGSTTNNNIKPPAATSGAITPAALAALSNISSGIIVGSSSSSSHINGHSTTTPTKRPRSPEADDGGIDLTGGFDHGQVGDDVGDGSEFVVDGDDDANGFGMASFDGPATFDDDSLTHESKRPRT